MVIQISVFSGKRHSSCCSAVSGLRGRLAAFDYPSLTVDEHDSRYSVDVGGILKISRKSIFSVWREAEIQMYEWIYVIVFFLRLCHFLPSTLRHQRKAEVLQSLKIITRRSGRPQKIGKTVAQ